MKAHPLTRLIAYAVDVCFGALIILVFVLSLVSSQTPSEILDKALILLILAVSLPVALALLDAYFTAHLGGSIGKILTGIAITTTEGRLISFWKALFRRQVGHIVNSSFLFAGYIWILVDKNRQGWHDLASNTIVVIKNRSWALLGLTALIITLGLNIYLAKSTVEKVRENNLVWQQLLQELKND